VEKAKSSIKAIAPYLNEDILNLDDISLLSNIESIIKIENITSCFILDETCKVIIHNDVNEWTTEKNADIYNNAIKHKTEFLQQMPGKESLLFSKPLINNCALFCTINMQRAKETSKYWRIKYHTIALSSSLIIVTVFYFFSKLLILTPFNRTKKILENQALENITDGKYNEITDIFTSERDKITKRMKILNEHNESLSKIIEYLQKTSIRDNESFIILNSLNEIVYAYDNIGNILKENYKKGCHIFEEAKSSELIQIVTKANENKRKEIEDRIGNCSVMAVSINDNNKIVGTIIRIKPLESKVHGSF
jgi:hypothetical protein